MTDPNSTTSTEAATEQAALAAQCAALALTNIARLAGKEQPKNNA